MLGRILIALAAAAMLLVTFTPDDAFARGGRGGGCLLPRPLQLWYLWQLGLSGRLWVLSGASVTRDALVSYLKTVNAFGLTAPQLLFASRW